MFVPNFNLTSQVDPEIFALEKRLGRAEPMLPKEQWPARVRKYKWIRAHSSIYCYLNIICCWHTYVFFSI